MSRRAAPFLLAACLAAATACSSSGHSATASGAGSASRGSGPVDVLYAGSLVDLMNDYVAPGFHAATGYSFNGTSGDAGTLANEIKGKTLVGDVFVSASPAKDLVLEGQANGDWVSWYASFATSSLVIGYDPRSRFAAAFRTEPWYQALAEPGLLLGRTDPATDPKGMLTVQALDAAAAKFSEPALAADATNSAEVFPENNLVGRLQAGQLDAGVFYSVEATAAHLDYVPVSGVGPFQATYTVTVLAHAPHPEGADAFVSYLLSPAGRQELTRAGMTLVSPPKVSGTPPSSLAAVLSGG